LEIEMSFIYHMVPKAMTGDVLFPLKDLIEKFPDLYSKEVKKYDDHPQRKELPKRILKKINCLQEEVLHFTPLHPHLMFLGLKSVFGDWNYSSRFYEMHAPVSDGTVCGGLPVPWSSC